MADMLALEHPLLKVPADQLVRTFKAAHRLVEGETNRIIKKIEQLGKTANKISPADAIKTLTSLCGKLDTLRSKLVQLQEDEQRLVDRCRQRVEHLQLGLSLSGTAGSGESLIWQQQRMDRILVDYLLREGFYDTALQLKEESGLGELVNVDIFVNSQAIEAALSQNDCSLALQWCTENESRLGKLKSTLEFKLRMQECIELVRQELFNEAIAYARMHFSKFAERHIEDIQMVMTLLVMPATSQRYAELLNPERWKDLIGQFRRNNFVLNSLTAHSLLSITLQAGLAALKTRSCYDPTNHNANCPVCHEDMNVLACGLPYSNHINSSLVCRLSGEIMNENNPPMALPNGHVYSQRALQNMWMQQHTIVCPHTGQVFQFGDLKKVYVM